MVARSEPRARFADVRLLLRSDSAAPHVWELVDDTWTPIDVAGEAPIAYRELAMIPGAIVRRQTSQSASAIARRQHAPNAAADACYAGGDGRCRSQTRHVQRVHG